MQQTSNYQLPTYQGTDSPNLITGYNSAMSKIDTQMKANETAASSAATAAANAATAASTADGKAVAAQNKANANETAIAALDTRVDALEDGGFAPSAQDATLNVTGLGNAKVTANGIVYIPTT